MPVKFENGQMTHLVIEVSFNFERQQLIEMIALTK